MMMLKMFHCLMPKKRQLPDLTGPRSGERCCTVLDRTQCCSVSVLVSLGGIEGGVVTVCL